MKLFQYGCSVSLGEEATTCYGKLLANKHGIEFVQRSESSASNPWIALHFVETCEDINPEDVIIFGWSHPNRQSWYNRHQQRWEHINYIQGKKDGSALVDSVKDYLVHQYAREGYVEQLHDWYPKHIVESTCMNKGLRWMHVDCVPGMCSILIKENKVKYIADHLHPNDEGHRYIFNMLEDKFSLLC